MSLPPELCSSGADEHDMHDTMAFDSKEALYSPARMSSALAATYTKHVEHVLDAHQAASGGARIGACLLEPGMQAAGGMLMLDPLFQNILARVRRHSTRHAMHIHMMRPFTALRRATCFRRFFQPRSANGAGRGGRCKPALLALP